MLLKKLYSAGFTLIELIVVVVIIITLTGLGIAGYNSFNQRQTLRQAAEEVKSNLRDAQNRALSGEKDCTICRGADLTCGTNDDPVLNYWLFSITGATTYTISGSCGALAFGSKSFTLATGLSFSPATLNIYFKTLAHGITNQGTVTITITQASTGNTINITITPSGEITIGDIT